MMIRVAASRASTVSDLGVDCVAVGSSSINEVQYVGIFLTQVKVQYGTVHVKQAGRPPPCAPSTTSPGGAAGVT